MYLLCHIHTYLIIIWTYHATCYLKWSTNKEILSESIQYLLWCVCLQVYTLCAHLTYILSYTHYLTVTNFSIFIKGGLALNSSRDVAWPSIFPPTRQIYGVLLVNQSLTNNCSWQHHTVARIIAFKRSRNTIYSHPHVKI